MAERAQPLGQHSFSAAYCMPCLGPCHQSEDVALRFPTAPPERAPASPRERMADMLHSAWLNRHEEDGWLAMADAVLVAGEGAEPIGCPTPGACSCTTEALAPAADRGAMPETCWLIERAIGGVPVWLAWRDRDAISWTPNPHEADRYEWCIAASREARMLAASLGVTCTAVEHQFPPPDARPGR